MLTDKEKQLLIEEQNRRVILKESISKNNPIFVEQAERCKAEDKVIPGIFFYQLEKGIDSVQDKNEAIFLIKKMSDNSRQDTEIVPCYVERRVS